MQSTVYYKCIYTFKKGLQLISSLWLNIYLKEKTSHIHLSFEALLPAGELINLRTFTYFSVHGEYELFIAF